MALYANSYSANGTSGKVITLDNLSITAFTPPTITSPLTSSGTVAGSFSYQTTATGNPTTFNLSGTLPTGLTFNSSTGRITGTPTKSGVFTLSLSATSGSYTGPSVSLRITIPALVGSYTSGYAASSQYTSSYTAAKAFDNNANTLWHSAAATFPHTIARDFGSAATIASISLNNGHLNGQNYATSLQVLGSNDNLVWTTLGTFPSLVAGLNTLSLSSPQTYRYFALKATAGSTTIFWGVRELIFVTNYASFTVPSPPRNLGAVAGTKIATLTWDPPTTNGGFAVSGYRIEFSTDNGMSWRYFATSTGSGTTFTATGLTSGQNYSFRVAAQSFLGTSSYNVENYGTLTDFSTTREAVLGSNSIYFFFITGMQFQSLTQCFLFFNAPSQGIGLPEATLIYLNREIYAQIVHGSELINQPFAISRTISSQKYYLRFAGSFGDRQEIYSSSVAPL
jgi:titin